MVGFRVRVVAAPHPQLKQANGNVNLLTSLRIVETHFQWTPVHNREPFDQPRFRSVVFVVLVRERCGMEPHGTRVAYVQSLIFHWNYDIGFKLNPQIVPG